MNEVPRVIDWANAQLEVQPQVAIGGVSMGGDIAVAAAGIDRRIDLVATALATPDWLRPGSQESQGSAEAIGDAFYRRLDPITHLERYADRPRFLFVCGDDDRQVPPESAAVFLKALDGSGGDSRRGLTLKRESSVAHRFTPWMFDQIVGWFVENQNS